MKQSNFPVSDKKGHTYKQQWNDLLFHFNLYLIDLLSSDLKPEKLRAKNLLILSLPEIVAKDVTNWHDHALFCKDDE
jgi:hypothetical protein